MTDGKTVARRSVRVFEADESTAVIEKVSTNDSTTSSIRLKPSTEEVGVNAAAPKEFYRHSRHSSTSTCSETAIDLQMDLMGSTLNGLAAENTNDSSTRTEKAAIKEKMESRSALNFGNVIPHVYRSACPEPEDHEFLRSLGLKTILSLADKERPEEYGKFIQDNGIKHIVVDMAGTKKGIPFDTMKTILSVVLDTRNYPMLIHCNHGRHRTGCVVAVVRKVNGMHVDSVVEEYKHFSNPKPRDVDIDYINTFSIATVQELVLRAHHGSKESRRATRRNPLLTMRVGQLVLGAAIVFSIWGVTILRWQ